MRSWAAESARPPRGSSLQTQLHPTGCMQCGREVSSFPEHGFESEACHRETALQEKLRCSLCVQNKACKSGRIAVWHKPGQREPSSNSWRKTSAMWKTIKCHGGELKLGIHRPTKAFRLFYEAPRIFPTSRLQFRPLLVLSWFIFWGTTTYYPQRNYIGVFRYQAA